MNDKPLSHPVFGQLNQKKTHIDAPDLKTILAVRSGKMRRIADDETVDLRELSKGGKVPKFVAVKRASIDAVENLLSHNPSDDIIKAGMDGVVERLRHTLMPSAPATIDVMEEIIETVSPLPPERRWPTIQRAFEKVERADARKRLKSAREKLQGVQERLRQAEETVEQKRRRLEALNHIKEISDAPVLQRLGETGFHKCVAAIDSNSCIHACLPVDVAGNVTLTHYDVDRGAHIFVVQHDWASAFERATDFSDGEFRLPYPASVFEFRISGARICFSIDADPETGIPDNSGLYVETRAGWALSHTCKWENGHWCAHSPFAPELLALCAAQVRAVSIALEAEVAETSIVRAPHRLNHKRERQGKPPILDYHVIDLAHRVRYSRRLPEPGDMESEHTRRRLHFVRGHTRHYPNFKIWIEWHLRGDPDLGFVDKEYRL